MTQPLTVPDVDTEVLRAAIKHEYAEVAADPGKGYHFHTGRTLVAKVGYADVLLESIPESAIESFAGTGNPFSLGEITPGERVVDVGSGAGIDSLIAAKLAGPTGRVIGVDMTPQMLDKARQAAGDRTNVEFLEGHAEALPVEDGWANVVISNGVINLCPDKLGVFRELHRVLKPGGRIQIADILVHKAVPDEAKNNVELWTG